ncbi:MAG: HAMP domain-containing protein [Eubacteriaceae bacterium]|nr:HAMP domain-containing protein [Eubacteriaceae bacterium]
MLISFRLRMYLYNIIILVISMVLIEVFVINTMERYSVNDAIKTLSAEADEISATSKQIIYQNNIYNIDRDVAFDENAMYFAEKYQLSTGRRIQVFNSSGDLLADSGGDINSETVSKDDKQEYYAEVYSALNSKKEAYMYTKINKENYVVYAIPIVVDESALGVIRTIYSMQSMDKLIHYTSLLFILATFIAILILIIIMMMSYKSLMGPINDITQMSRDMSEGVLDKRFVIYKSKDEINLLKDNFNKMADEITRRIYDYKEKQFELSLMLASIDSGVIAIDSDDNIITLNESAKSMLGYENIPDENIKLSMLNEIGDVVLNLRKTNQEVIKEIVFNDKNLYVCAKYAGKSTMYIDVLVIIKDITKDKLVKKEQNKFLSSISHELRTPLTTIIGYTDMLTRRGTDNTEITAKALNTINKEGQRLLRLVDDVLLMNKYDKIDFDMIFSYMDVDDVLNDVVEAMRIKSMKFGIDISYTATELPAIFGDYDRIKQVFINILDNAIKYSYEGGKINVTATSNDKNIQVDIRDYGIGVPSDMIENVFEAFYRVDEERSRERGGFGLGLSIVKQIIKSHGGKVTLKSKEGEGTLITVILPAKQNQSFKQEDKK